MAQQLDLNEKKELLGRNGDRRFEPWIEFANWSKELNKAVVSYDVRAQATALKKTSSNLQITGKKVLLTVEPPAAFVAEGHASGNWGPFTGIKGNHLELVRWLNPVYIASFDPSKAPHLAPA